MAGRLAERLAVVTGAGKGIGRAIVLALLEEGARVVAVARTAADLERLAADAAAAPGQVLPSVGDVTDAAFVETLFSDLGRQHGKLDILINNAGIAPFASIFDMTPGAFKNCLDTNVYGVFLCTQQAVRLMRPAGRGKIVNIGSVCSHWTGGSAGIAYSASKYALRAFTECVARELHGSGLHIAVSLVCPGVVDTTLTNPSREARPQWLDPADIARAVLHTVTAPDDVNVYDTVVIPMFQKVW